jgi:hypothetical protein
MYHLEKYDSMGEGGGGEKNEIVIWKKVNEQ